MSDNKVNAEQLVADQILELLEAGELPPWEKPWDGNNPWPAQVNAISGLAYRGINYYLTLLKAQVNAYNDPRWLTFKQATSAGGNVKKGEKSSAIVFWKMLRKGPANEQEDQEGQYWPMARIYRVFNLEQTENCNLPPIPKPSAPERNPIELAEEIISKMPDPPEIRIVNYDDVPPCYVPQLDIIRTPRMDLFRTPELYYEALFHELVHSTGHPSRLHRFEIETTREHLHDYGREELVAGMGSAMLGQAAGIGKTTLQDAASYIQGWIETIAADRSVVIRAAQRAQRAVDSILAAPAV